eukprot:COSAG02_NODE_2036_length_10039_cov_174.290040_1_plen_1339_part_00
MNAQAGSSAPRTERVRAEYSAKQQQQAADTEAASDVPVLSPEPSPSTRRKKKKSKKNKARDLLEPARDHIKIADELGSGDVEENGEGRIEHYKKALGLLEQSLETASEISDRLKVKRYIEETNVKIDEILKAVPELGSSTGSFTGTPDELPGWRPTNSPMGLIARAFDPMPRQLVAQKQDLLAELAQQGAMGAPRQAGNQGIVSMYREAPPKLQADRDVVLAALKAAGQNAGTRGGLPVRCVAAVLCSAPAELQADTELVRVVYGIDNTDRQAVLAKLAKDPSFLPHVSTELQRQIVTEAKIDTAASAEVAAVAEDELPKAHVPSLIRAVGGSEEAFYLKLLQSQEQQHQMFRCKLMFVGSARAGKTSVKLQLMGKGFSETQDSTSGIEVDVETWTGDSASGGVSDFKEAVGKQLAEAQQAQVAKEEAVGKQLAEAQRAQRAQVAKEEAAAAAEAVLVARAAPFVPNFALDLEPELDVDSEQEPEPEPELAARALQGTHQKPQHESEPEHKPQRRSSFSMDDYAAVVAQILNSKPSTTKKVTLFDFAGQRMYYQMHHIFITPKLSIYLIVFSLEAAPDDALEGEDAECGLTQLQNLHFWLNSVHAQAPDAPIIVVGTHRASITDEVAAERLAMIESTFERTAFYDQLRNGGKVFCVDNKEDDASTFDALRAVIATEIDQLPDFNAPVPLRWLRFLDVLQEKGEQRMSLETAAKIAKHLHIAEQQELMLMLKLFTDVGLLMHFDVDGLRDVVVLQPRWLLNNMRNLLCLRHLDSMIGEAKQGTEKAELLALKAKVDHGLARTALLNLRDKGVLDPEVVLPVLWNELSQEDRGSMLQYMAHFTLCCPLPGTLAAARHHHVLPSLFAVDGAKSCWSTLEGDMRASLSFVHGDSVHGEDGSSYLPQALFHSVVLRLLERSVEPREAFKHLYYDRVVIVSAEASYLLHCMKHAPVGSAGPLQSGCRIELTVRADSEQPAAAYHALSQVQSCLAEMEEKYGVRSRVEVPSSAGDDADDDFVVLQTGKGNRTHRLDTAACVPWREPATAEPEPELKGSAADGKEEDGGMHALLVSAKLESHEAALQAAGCLLVDDLRDADAEDLVELGFNKFEVKRLGRTLKRLAKPPSGTPAFPLPPAKKFHFFICHHQGSGGDQSNNLYIRLEQLGYKVWYDNGQNALHRNLEGMRYGVRMSVCLLIFLSGRKETKTIADRAGEYEGPFTRWFCHEEMAMAHAERLRCIGVMETEERRCKPDFELEKSRALTGGKDGGPVNANAARNLHLLNDICFIPLRRQEHEVQGMLAEIQKQAMEAPALLPFPVIAEGIPPELELEPEPEPEPDVGVGT